jgi:hypothetical protein
MKKNRAFGLLALAVALLGGCQGSAADQPITGNHPAPPTTNAAAPPDTTAPASSKQVPFVNPTKAGRALGEQTPSPPASRIH